MKSNLIAGLISGLVVTLFVVIFRALWNRIVVPWFEERVYKDARIEGEWFSLYPFSKDKRQETITLKRHGHSVTGVIICTGGNDQGTKYHVSGSFRNLILPLTYEVDDRSKTDRGTITLRLLRDGQRLEGKLAFYYAVKDVISDADVIWFRSRDNLEKFLDEAQKRKKAVEDFEKAMREARAAKQELTRDAAKDTDDKEKNELSEASAA